MLQISKEEVFSCQDFVLRVFWIFKKNFLFSDEAAFFAQFVRTNKLLN